MYIIYICVYINILKLHGFFYKWRSMHCQRKVSCKNLSYQNLLIIVTNGNCLPTYEQIPMHLKSKFLLKILKCNINNIKKILGRFKVVTSFDNNSKFLHNLRRVENSVKHLQKSFLQNS